MATQPLKTFSSSSPESDKFDAWFDETHTEVLTDDDIPEFDASEDEDE